MRLEGTPAERAGIYALIATMFSEPNEIIRSCMAQDLSRSLQLGVFAEDKCERVLHLDTARKALATRAVTQAAHGVDQRVASGVKGGGNGK